MFISATVIKGATNLAPVIPASAVLQPASKAAVAAAGVTAVLGAVSWPASAAFGAVAAEISIAGDNYYDTDNNTL